MFAEGTAGIKKGSVFLCHEMPDIIADPSGLAFALCALDDIPVLILKFALVKIYHRKSQMNSKLKVCTMPTFSRTPATRIWRIMIFGFSEAQQTIQYLGLECKEKYRPLFDGMTPFANLRILLFCDQATL